jgi:hypothetical protein
MKIGRTTAISVRFDDRSLSVIVDPADCVPVDVVSRLAAVAEDLENDQTSG